MLDYWNRNPLAVFITLCGIFALVGIWSYTTSKARCDEQGGELLYLHNTGWKCFAPGTVIH